MASYAGNYTGTFSGAEVGTFNINISSTGVLTGSGFSQTLNSSFGGAGQVGANGAVSLTATGQAGSASFSGSISPTGAFTGTWSYDPPAIGGGTFTGQRSASATGEIISWSATVESCPVMPTLLQHNGLRAW